VSVEKKPEILDAEGMLILSSTVTKTHNEKIVMISSVSVCLDNSLSPCHNVRSTGLFREGETEAGRDEIIHSGPHLAMLASLQVK
jgi:hypothetical protein